MLQMSEFACIVLPVWDTMLGEMIFIMLQLCFHNPPPNKDLYTY